MPTVGSQGVAFSCRWDIPVHIKPHALILEPSTPFPESQTVKQALLLSLSLSSLELSDTPVYEP